MLELFNEGRCCDIIGKESIGDNLSGFRADTALIVQQYCGAACATNLENVPRLSVILHSGSSNR